jgi:ubiquinone/menaquinone biosynthesis C-methylase UbiE
MENAGPRELPGAGTPGGEPGEGGVDTYERLYEAHARSHTAEEAIGGSFDLVGRLELGVLMVEGLRPTDTLVDLGCGTGRLAVHAIPALPDGRYVGIDISDSMLREARERVRGIAGAGQCSVSWVKQTGPVFALETGSVDVICAFSVFTHMEHEDTYRYLKNALRIVRPGGRFVFSCLPMNLKLARVVFLQSAADDLQTRWSKVRNVTTSVEMMTTIAELAGWTPLRWYDGEEENIPLPETGEKHSLGQSVCILEAPRENRAGSA